MLALMPAVLAHGQAPGVTGTDITIGSCAALDGPARQLGLQMVMGATMYFDMINEQGGVNGRRIHLQAYDDGYNPDKAGACFARLQREQVFAGGFFVGTPTAAKYVPLVEEARLPVVGWFTGAELLYQPFHKHVFNIRASYFDETREQVDNLWALGMRKIGIIYPDDAFGAAVLDGVKQALKKHGSALAGQASYVRNTTAVDGAVMTMRGANPEAVVVVGPYAPVAAMVKRAHERGWRPQFLTVSFVGTDDFIREAGDDAEGTIITQVVPPYYLTELPTVALYRKQLQSHGGQNQPGFTSLEGFVDAMVLVEGLKLAGRNITREKLVTALESIHNKDLGLGPKLKLNYGPAMHKGLTNVYPTIVRSGTAVPITDWKQIKQ